jgi:hypothetical protein
MVTKQEVRLKGSKVILARGDHHTPGHWLLASLVALGLSLVLILFDPAALVAQSQQGQVRVLQSDTNRIVLELELTGYETREVRVDTGVYTVITVPGLGHTSKPGDPQLPIKGAMVAIPPGAQPALRVLADESQVRSLARPPLPNPTQRVQSVPGESLPRYAGSTYAPNSAIYGANATYPAEVARIASTGDWRSQRYAVVEFHPFQYNPATRQLIFHRRLRVELVLNYPQGRTLQALGGSVNEGAFEKIFQQSILNYSSGTNWRARTLPSRLPTTTRSARYSGGPWYKIAVQSDGIYRITCPQLQAAGINLTTLDPTTVKIFKQDLELAIRYVGPCNGSSGYFEFFGKSVNTKYANTNIYWLTFGSGAGKRMSQRDGSGTGTVPAWFTDTIHLEQDKDYYSYLPLPRAEDDDHWFWAFSSPYYSAPYADFSFQVPNPASTGGSATLTANILGFSLTDHHTRILINGTQVYENVWSGQGILQTTISFPQSLLTSGTNTIRVTELNDVHPQTVVYTNFFDVNYARNFVAVTDTLRLRQTQNGTWQYQISNFTESNIDVFDITDPYNVAQITNAVISGGPPYTLQFADTVNSPKEYIALTAAQRKSPLSITLDTPSDLRNTNNAADYIVIAYGGFIPNIQPLANYRQSQGLRVKVVDVQDVYDEFSDGLMDPQAIRDFIAYAYAYWRAPAPSMVLLVGDGTFDPKGNCVTPGVCPFILTNNSTFIPPFLRLVDPWIGETASDNRFVSLFVTSTLPSLAIGRLPANNTAEVDAMVNKIIGYESSPAVESWQSKITFVSDNTYSQYGVQDSAGNFWELSDQIANNMQLLPGPFWRDRIYFNPCLDTTSYPWCALPYPPYPDSASTRSGIISAINDGRLIVNYIGHGAPGFWANEIIFSRDDIASLTNGSRLPMFLEMTCYTGYFHFNHSNGSGLGEVNVRAAGKGALASWSATGLGVAQGHDFINRGFFDAVFQKKITQIGPATVYGKLTLFLDSGGYHLDLLDTFVLLGDPASKLDVPLFTFLPFIRR